MTFSSDTASDIPTPQEHYIHCARCSAPYLSSDGTAQACDCTPAKTHKEQFLSGCFGSHQHNCARYTVRTPTS